MYTHLRLTPIWHSVSNVKALVASHQEKALVGAFSVIVETGCGTDGALHSTTIYTEVETITRTWLLVILTKFADAGGY